jgi:hypothetical protein
MLNYTSSPALTNVLFSGNRVLFDGGGMANDAVSNPTLINVTVAGNQAGNKGGGLQSGDGGALLQNRFLWGNRAPANPNLDSTLPLTIQHSLVQSVTMAVDGNLDGATPLSFVRLPECGANGCGEHPDTPGVDEGADDDYGDLRLHFSSPAIDAGNNASISETLDLAGNPRVVAFYAQTPIVDLGAYETQASAPPLFTGTVVTAAIQDQLFSYGVSATDPDLARGDAITITAELKPNLITITVSTKPAWLNLVGSSDVMTFTGTPTVTDSGLHPVILQVRDSAGLTATQNFSITVVGSTGGVTGLVRNAAEQGIAGALITLAPVDVHSTAGLSQQTISNSAGRYTLLKARVQPSSFCTALLGRLLDTNIAILWTGNSGYNQVK